MTGPALGSGVGAGVVETEATCSASSSDASNPGIAGVGGILPQKSVCVVKKDGQPAEATTAQGSGNDTFEEISQRDPRKGKSRELTMTPPWICPEPASRPCLSWQATQRQR